MALLRRIPKWFTCAAVLALLAAPVARERGAALPPIVFVSRHRPDPAGPDAGQIPGLGPHGSTIKVGGRLLIRDPDGAVRELLHPGAFYDVQDPDVSFDGKWIAFSGCVARDSAWRIWVVGVDGSGLRAVTAQGDGDDFDPCWLDTALVWVSTRAQVARSLYDGSPIGHLCTSLRGLLMPIERNGVLDPTPDTAHGRLVYARWWFNPYAPAKAGGVTRSAAEAMKADTVNQWQLVSARPRMAAPGGTDGTATLVPFLSDERLLAGGSPDRRAGMGVQPAILADGEIAAVYAQNTGLAPRAGAVGLHRMRRGGGAGVRIGGAAIPSDARSVYAEGSRLAAPTMCAPAALPDGRLVVSADPGARGDLGLWLLDARGEPVRALAAQEGMLELDAAIVRARPRFRAERDRDALAGGSRSQFLYENRDVFAGAGSPSRVAGARLRAYADTRFREGTGSDVTLVADEPIGPGGRVSLRFEAAVPMFEQLVDSTGRLLMTAHGPAQVRGFNTGAGAHAARCVGCHLGHSASR